MERLYVQAAVDDGSSTRQSLPQDPGQAGLAQKRQIGVNLDGHDYVVTTEEGDKVNRALPVAAAWNNSLIRIVRAPWNDAFLAELASFPRGAFKDQVDALSRAYNDLLGKREARVGDGGYVVGAEEDDEGGALVGEYA